MPEPRKFKHQKLMNEFNEMMIRIKLHLFCVGDTADFINNPEPTVEELDDLTNKIMAVLREDSEPMIKH
jgi:hypothetical protein